MFHRIPSPAVFLAALLVGISPGVASEKTRKPPWSVQAEFSYVATGGNSDSTSAGLATSALRKWDRAELLLRVRAVRAAASDDEFAIGAANDFRIVEPRRETTAENFKLESRFDHRLARKRIWYTGGGWERNRFSGIENRWSLQGGVGNVWIDRDDTNFKTDYALTASRQENLDGTVESFPGVRFSSTFLRKFGKNSRYENTLLLDENLDNTSDFRVDLVNAVGVSLTEKLGLKVSLQLLYDNVPSFAEVDLLAPDLSPTNTRVSIELDELDTVLRTSLVVNF